jgi:hypothetical protein
MNGKWLVFLGWSLAIFYLMDIFKTSESQLAGDVMAWFIAHGLPYWLPAKVLHVAVFGAWTFLFGSAITDSYTATMSWRQITFCFLGIVVFACIPEGLQCLNASRHPAWMDVGFNLAGSGIGLTIRILTSCREDRLMPVQNQTFSPRAEHST